MKKYVYISNGAFYTLLIIILLLGVTHTNSRSQVKPFSKPRPLEGIFYLGMCDSIVYATIGLSPYLSSNYGTTWTERKSFTDSVDYLTSSNKTLFIVTLGNRLFRSKDRGDHWKIISTPQKTKAVHFIATSNAIFTHSDSGLFRSTDDGDSWSEIRHVSHIENIDVLQNILNIEESDTDTKSTESTFILRLGFHSSDNGNSWLSGFSGNGDNPFSPFWRVNIPNDSERILLDQVNYSDSVAYGLLRPDDVGKEWIDADNTTQLRRAYIDSSVDNRFFCSWKSGFLFSTDSGRTSKISSIVQGSKPQQLLRIPHGFLLSTWEDGFFRSTNEGLTWSHLDTVGLPAMIPSDSQFARSGDTIICVQNFMHSYRSTNNGRTWYKLITLNGNANEVRISGKYFFIKTYVNDLVYSSDGGVVWHKSFNNSNTPVYFNSYHGQVYSDGRGAGLLRWNLTNNSWDTLNTFGAVRTLQFQPHSIIELSKRSKIFYSTDNGIKWKELPTQTVFSPTIIEYQNECILQDSSGLRVFSEKSGQWQTIHPHGLPQNLKNVVGVVTNGKTLFTAVENTSNLFKSNDGGHHWKQMNGISGKISNIFFESGTLTVYIDYNKKYHSTDEGKNWKIEKWTPSLVGDY
jgi:photosystem II stability/assembly factor-like uncharacterized protein